MRRIDADAGGLQDVLCTNWLGCHSDLNNCSNSTLLVVIEQGGEAWATSVPAPDKYAAGWRFFQSYKG